MSREHVSHREIARFADEQVNLPREKATQFREQANRLRDKLEDYLKVNPNFELQRMIISGSLAKGTPLRTLNDIDVACYIGGVEDPQDNRNLLNYLHDRLRKAFPNFTSDQVQSKTHCLTVSFKGTGLDVDIVPILYDKEADKNQDGTLNWDGILVSQDDGSLLKTNVPKHIEFIRKRKGENSNFSQVVKLVKFWANNQKMQDENFRFKSFMIELILAKLSDEKKDFEDYPEALQNFFTYIVQSNFREMIAFCDYHDFPSANSFKGPIRIIDPVNTENNVAEKYTQTLATAIVSAANDAGDAIDAALAAPTKQLTVGYWQQVFGPSFYI